MTNVNICELVMTFRTWGNWEINLDEESCRADVEKCFAQVLNELGSKGWHPAQTAMTLADVAEDFTMAFPIRASL